MHPTGTVTFLFTDVEGSTSAWEAHVDAMAEAIARHDAIVRRTIGGAGGYVFSTAGDAFAAAFSTPADAVRAALEAQRLLAAEPWPAPLALRVRMGLHVGVAVERDGDYFGPTVNRAARIMAAAHGGQVLASGAVVAHLGGTAVDVRDLGEHRLRDLEGTEQLLQLGADGLPDTFPPLRTLDRYPSTLPAQRSTFVGREDERRRIRQALDASRLVTLTGVGGTGKTRLAVEVAHDLSDASPGGVFFVDLARLTDGAFVWEAIAAGLDFAPDPGAEVPRQVTARLGARRALVVVDNCEHVLDDAADAVDAVLAACPAVRLLATSREGLALDGERVVPIAPLSTDATAERAAPAVRLFLERAADAHGARYDAADLAVIHQICLRLDGLPLAIELAAARTAVLSPADLLARLENRFRLLTGGRRGKRNRQRTLEEAIAWSYDLLDPAEQVLLRNLAVFPAAFDLARAAAVAGGGDDTATLDLLDSLSGKSLVQVERGQGGGTRYRLLETIREYAQARLVEAGNADEVRLRHATDTAERAEAARQHLFQVSAALDELVDDILVALDRADALGRSDLLVRLCAASPSLMMDRGLLQPARTWLRRALEVSPPEQHGPLHVALAAVEMIRNNMGGMRRHAEAGAADPDPRVEGPALVFRIIMTAILDPPAAEQQAARAEELMASGRIPHAVSALSLAIGGFHLWHERDEAAAKAFERGRAMAPDDDASGAMTSGGLILALLGAQRLEAAAALLADPRFDARRKIWRERAARGAQWYATTELAAAVAAAARGDVDEGRRMVAAVHALLGRERFSAVDSDLVATLAAICLHAGETERARELLADTQHVSRTPMTMALAYRTLAAATGRTGPGAVEWRAAEVVRRNAIDRATIDAAARRMVEAELARLGLAGEEEGRAWSAGGTRR
jgi:predicted ATPase/class 3 adenylate cyclase